MKKLALSLALLATLSLGVACNNNKKDQQATSTENTATGTSTQAGNSNDNAKVDDDKINNALTAANLGSVKVHVDNDKNVVSLKGEVNSSDQKDQAEQIAKQNASGYVVANEIAVRPTDSNTNAKKVDNKTDDAIKSSFQALAAKNQWDNQHINPDVTNGVLTLKGDVDSQSQRTAIEKAAAKIPHVKQVVNELSVKDAGK